MSSNELAFFIGLFGSLHCVGMCGPLAFAIPAFHNRRWLVVADKLLYNLGRVITYTFLGLLTGLIGKQLWLYHLQQGVSLLSGTLIIVTGLSYLLRVRLLRANLNMGMPKLVSRLIGYALRHKAGHLVVGLLNGFLPCGFVYLALAGAVNSASPANAACYMFWFGAGTFPMMLLATIGSGLIGPAIRRRINRALPYLMVCLGFWFVLRGMNLNIPYLSPARPTSAVSVCH